MKLLKQIKIDEIKDENKVSLREAVRIIGIDENGLIPLLFVSKNNYHKLPGGGIEEGEEKMNALKRECLEEIGSEIEVTGEVGEIREYREKFNIKQISYCYFGRITSKGEPQFTEEENKNGFQIIWKSITQAIEILKNDAPQDYEGIFIQERDLCFLEEYSSIISS